MNTGTKTIGLLLAFSILGSAPKTNGQTATPKEPTQDEIVDVCSRIESAAKAEDRDSLSRSAQDIDWMAVRILDKAATNESNRIKRFEELLVLLEAVASAQAPDFDPSDWPAGNIAPPVGKSGRLYDSGITPESIKEPEVRKAYEDALARNSLKAKRFSAQWQVMRMKDSFLGRIGEFRIAFFGYSERDLGALRQAVDKLITDKTARSELYEVLALPEAP